MPNEKQVKEAALCSVTQRDCGCDEGNGCAERMARAGVDPTAVQTLRWLRTANVYIGEACHTLDNIQDPYELQRQYPAPEVREIRRKLETAMAMIQEIL